MNKIFVISRLITKFTKILCHENLELYGTSFKLVTGRGQQQQRYRPYHHSLVEQACFSRPLVYLPLPSMKDGFPEMGMALCRPCLGVCVGAASLAVRTVCVHVCVMWSNLKY